MNKPEIFAGRLREGAFTIIASPDTTSDDSGTAGLAVFLIESDSIYYAKFSDAQLSSKCLGASARNMTAWFSDLEVFRRNDDGSVIVFLTENGVIRIVITLNKIDLAAVAATKDRQSRNSTNADTIMPTHEKKRRHSTNARISEWSEDEESAADIAEFNKLKRRYPYINVELPAKSAALKRLRTYNSSDDSEHETSSDHE